MGKSISGLVCLKRLETRSMKRETIIKLLKKSFDSFFPTESKFNAGSSSVVNILLENICSSHAKFGKFFYSIHLVIVT